MKFCYNDIGCTVSIIVPVYNVEKYLEKCIDSIIIQTYQNLEIILVDDGSIDSSSSICDKYKGRDCRINVIHKINEGLVSSRREGIAASHGDYLTFVDGDDWVEPDFIENLIHDAVTTGADVVTSGFIMFDNNDNKSVITDLISSGLYIGKEELERKIYSKMICFDKEGRPGITVATWDKLFRTEIIRRHSDKISYHIKWGTDFVLTFPCILDSEIISIRSDIAKYHYRVNDMSLTINYDRDFICHAEELIRGVQASFRTEYTEMLRLQLIAVELQWILQRGVNNESSRCRNPINRAFSLLRYNRKICSNEVLYKVITDANKVKNDFILKYAELVEVLCKKQYIKAVYVELFKQK